MPGQRHTGRGTECKQTVMTGYKPCCSRKKGLCGGHQGACPKEVRPGLNREMSQTRLLKKGREGTRRTRAEVRPCLARSPSVGLETEVPREGLRMRLEPG